MFLPRLVTYINAHGSFKYGQRKFVVFSFAFWFAELNMPTQNDFALFLRSDSGYSKFRIRPFPYARTKMRIRASLYETLVVRSCSFEWCTLIFKNEPTYRALFCCFLLGCPQEILSAVWVHLRKQGTIWTTKLQCIKHWYWKSIVLSGALWFGKMNLAKRHYFSVFSEIGSRNSKWPISPCAVLKHKIHM